VNGTTSCGSVTSCTVPVGAGITSGGAFTWTPTSGQIGTFRFFVKVTDNGTPNLSDDEEITVTVSKRMTTLVYSGDSSGVYSDPTTVKATLTDNSGGALQGTGISGKAIHFTIGSQSTSPDPTTNGSGVAQGSITLNQAAVITTVASSFTTDAAYYGSSD